MFCPFKKQPLIGLDFNSEEIRLVQLVQKADGLAVERLVHSKLSLPALVTEQGLKGASVAFALPAELLMRKQIELPGTYPERELDAEIERRLLEYFPGIPENQLYFDYQPVEREEHASQLLLVAVRKKDLDYYLKQVSEAGLLAEVVDSQLYASLRSFLFQQKPKQPFRGALLDLQPTLCSLMVIEQEELLFHYSWTNKQTKPLLEQITHSLELYSATHPQKALTTLSLSGVLPLEEEELQWEEQLSLPLHPFNPFQGMKFNAALREEQGQNLASGFLIACGLALRGLSCD